RATLSESLKQRGSGGESRGRGRARAVLVVAQVSLSVILLIGAGLLIRSFALLGSVQAGFQAPPDRVLTMRVFPTGPRYRERSATFAYWDQLLDRVKRLPGVESASIAMAIPPDRIFFTDAYEIEGKPLAPGSQHAAAVIPVVSYDYFTTLGIPLLRGR